MVLLYTISQWPSVFSTQAMQICHSHTGDLIMLITLLKKRLVERYYSTFAYHITMTVGFSIVAIQTSGMHAQAQTKKYIQ